MLMHCLLLISAVILSSISQSFSKKLCTRKFHNISNSDFVQRVEQPSPERCVESCIEHLDFCKAAVFTQTKNKRNGFCLLYPVNSLSKKVNISVDGRLNPMSSVFEILDKCAPSISANKDGITEKISSKSRKKLEEWKDKPESEKTETSESEDSEAFTPNKEAEEGYLAGSSPHGHRGSSDVDFHLPPIPATEEFEKAELEASAGSRSELLRPSKYGEGRGIPIEPQGGESSSYISARRVGEGSSYPDERRGGEGSKYPDERRGSEGSNFPEERRVGEGPNYPEERRGGESSNYPEERRGGEISSYSEGPRSEILPETPSRGGGYPSPEGLLEVPKPHGPPIKPAQVLYGGRPVNCAGVNCYAPALPSPFGRAVYPSSPCRATFIGDPCLPPPRLPDPCKSVRHFHANPHSFRLPPCF